MDITKVVSRRAALGAALAVTATLAACAMVRTSALATPPATKCPDPPSLGMAPIPLTQRTKRLIEKYEGCITEIATAQDLIPDAQNDVKQLVTGVNCPAGVTQTTLQVGEYHNAGQIGDGHYGDGPGKNRGFIVARVKNIGPCTTAGKLAIPPNAVLVWIIEKPKDEAKRSQIVLLNGGTETPLNGRYDYEIKTCNHSGNTGDAAQAKVGNPCTTYRTPPSPLNIHGGPGVEEELSLWLVCGGDCCYTRGS